MRTQGTGEELIWRVGPSRKAKRPILTYALVALVAVGGKALWDARSRSMPIDVARSVDQDDGQAKQIAAIVTLFRESLDNTKVLLEFSRSPNPKVAEQAAIALNHLRTQLK